MVKSAIGYPRDCCSAVPMWRASGPPRTPEPSSRVAGRMALGWALACSAFARYKAPPRGFAKLVWPKSADRGLVERLARGIGLARDLINTPAEHMGPAELAGAAEDLARRHTPRFRALVGDPPLAHNYPLIHPARPPSPRAPPP